MSTISISISSYWKWKWKWSKIFIISISEHLSKNDRSPYWVRNECLYGQPTTTTATTTKKTTTDNNNNNNNNNNNQQNTTTNNNTINQQPTTTTNNNQQRPTTTNNNQQLPTTTHNNTKKNSKMVSAIHQLESTPARESPPPSRRSPPPNGKFELRQACTYWSTRRTHACTRSRTAGYVFNMASCNLTKIRYWRQSNEVSWTPHNLPGYFILLYIECLWCTYSLCVCSCPSHLGSAEWVHLFHCEYDHLSLRKRFKWSSTWQLVW